MASKAARSKRLREVKSQSEEEDFEMSKEEKQVEETKAETDKLKEKVQELEKSLQESAVLAGRFKDERDMAIIKLRGIGETLKSLGRGVLDDDKESRNAP